MKTTTIDMNAEAMKAAQQEQYREKFRPLAGEVAKQIWTDKAFSLFGQMHYTSELAEENDNGIGIVFTYVFVEKSFFYRERITVSKRYEASLLDDIATITSYDVDTVRLDDMRKADLDITSYIMGSYGFVSALADLILS